MGKAKSGSTTVPVTARAVEQRVNRKLAKKSRKLMKAGSKAARAEMGDYFIIDKAGGTGVVRRNVNLEALARELGALESWERLEG
jgi:hypothetical protein